ncbi:MAG: 50S ribosomal protein L21 [Spirochaetia bacterium]|nr:50S ribosomal protein L21 [Spirochaetia bacterium]
MYALIDMKGKQYKAEKGALLRMDRIDAEKGSSVEFDTIMLLSDEGTQKIGTPYLEGVKVTGTVEDQIKDTKVIVMKYKRRKNYKRTRGHRAQYTIVKVTDIIGA